MFEIAGMIVSGISGFKNLRDLFKDISRWDERDLLVDGDWLALALTKGKLEGAEGDFVWSRAESVATRELKGTHAVVMPYNEEKKIKYRIVRGQPNDQLVLMRRI